MKASVIWWDLGQSTQTIQSLRQYLKEKAVDPWKEIQGMLLKFWISNVEKNLWGAVMVWQDEKFSKQLLPPNRALELIGYPPVYRFTFDIEAMVEGEHLYESFNKLGLIYQEN